MSTKELLHEEILEKHGAFQRVRRYWKGWHPELEDAVLTNGWTGKETKQEIDVIRPSKTFRIK